MTANPLKSVAPVGKRTPQEWVDRGNALLAGTLANKDGEYLTPRPDVHWVLRDGKPVIEWRR